MTPTEKALLTWYQPDNPLYKNPLHPTIKLAGEIGELLDLYGKNEYKPGFDWMRCKNCGQVNCDKEQDKSEACFGSYISIVLDELGDIWYYLRILAWIYDVELEAQLMLPDETETYPSIKSMYLQSAIMLNKENKKMVKYRLNEIFQSLNQLLINLDYTLDELTEFNFAKLNSDDNNHGWKRAR